MRFKGTVIMTILLAVIIMGSLGSFNWSTENTIKGIPSLTTKIKEIIKEKNIPGMALAIVRGEMVVFKKCFGLANIEKRTEVTERTLFPIGSSTKPFTSNLVALLVSRGKMNWNDPIIHYLPEFKLAIDSYDKKKQVTIRDLLSHRTGFFHMDLVQKIFSGEKGWTREKLLKEAVKYKPIDEFRKVHNYSNISMLAAGMASAKAAGEHWDDLMSSLLFNPLGMNNTTTITSKALENTNLATGYMNNGGENVPAPLINLDGIAPAGGIFSTLHDMIQWVKFINLKGIIHGRRLIDEKELIETWKSHVKVKENLIKDTEYGMGWFLTKWREYKVVEHPGNSMGYSAHVAFIPKLDLGFVLLSNVLPNPLQFTIRNMIFEALVIDQN
jgi:CubicO group peptidase (beta-lactamase class C family)